MDNQLIKYLQLLYPLTKADMELIAGYFTPQTFKQGDYLSRPNKIAREMFFVESGVIRIGSINEKGADLTHYFYGENNLVSILHSFNEEVPMPAFIQACTNAEVLTISKSKLQQLYQQLPFLKQVIDQQNQQHLIEKVNVHNLYQGEDAENRYHLFVSRNPNIALRVALKEIASYLGITPQSLSRIRRGK